VSNARGDVNSINWLAHNDANFIPFPNNNNVVTYYKIIICEPDAGAETCEMKVFPSPREHTAICIQAQTAQTFSRVFLRLKRGVYCWKRKCFTAHVTVSCTVQSLQLFFMF
jgi:hypothetical protein